MNQATLLSPDLSHSAAMKHRVQALLNKFRAVFSKKKATSLNAADNGSTDRTPNETTRLADGCSRSSSVKGSVKSKPSMSPANREGAQGWARSQSFERPEDKASGPSRVSESPSMSPIMPQLPTILVGEVMEPIGLDTRKDSEHLPRDDHVIEQDTIPA